MEVSD